MDYVGEVRQLISNSKYRDASKMLDGMLAADKNNDELWYLRGIVSMRLQGYDAAQEYFDRALMIKQKVAYHRMKGMAYFEMFYLDRALESFMNVLKIDGKDFLANYFMALCYVLMDDPRASTYLKVAFAINAKRTKQLLVRFYELFVQIDPTVQQAQKKLLFQKISALG